VRGERWIAAEQLVAAITAEDNLDVLSGEFRQKISGDERRVAKRFIEIMDAKNADPELFKIKVDLLKIEDAEFAKLRQMHEAKKANDTEKYDQLKAELQAQAPDYVKARLAERKPPQRLVLVGVGVTRLEAPPVPADTLVIHGENDETVPLAAVLEWARPQELPVVLVPGADHFFHRKLHVLRTIVTSNWK